MGALATGLNAHSQDMESQEWLSLDMELWKVQALFPGFCLPTPNPISVVDLCYFCCLEETRWDKCADNVL